MSDLKITTIEELKKMASGEVVELPPFADGMPFVARLKRPSMLAMVKSGKIPNSLLVEANKLFTGGPSAAVKNVENEAMMGELVTILDAICSEAFMEPSYKDMMAAGVELTDEQYMAVFNYTQNGVKSLESFRQQR